MNLRGNPDYFKSICNVNKAFGSTLSRDRLLEMVVQSAVDTMDAKSACLFMTNDKNNTIVPVAQKGLSDSRIQVDLKNPEATVQAILKSGYLYIRDAGRDALVEHHDLDKTGSITSILVVPVVVHDKAIGLLALYTDREREFNRKEIDFLTAIAAQGGQAIEHARLIDRIRKNSLLFLDLVSSINSSLDIEKILHILTTEICQALGMKGVSIRLLNEAQGTLDLVASYGMSEAFLNKGPVCAKKSISDALNGKSVIVCDVATDKRIQYRNETLAEGIASLLCVPIKARENVIGVMRLFSRVKRDFPEDVLMLIEALAHAGGLAIQNASMYLQLQHDKDTMEKDFWASRSWF
jgi:GAF domain-containing protein